MKRFAFLFAIAVVLGLFVVHQPAVAIVYNLSGPMDALQAGTNGGFGSFDGGVSGAGDGTGSVTGTYDDVTNLLNYTITWQNLTSNVSNMHFHIGAPGVSGGVELAVPGPWSSPQVGTNISLDDNEEINLLAGVWYLNVHTGSFGGGEIRGQISAVAIPEPSAMGLALLASMALAVRRR